MSRRDGRSRTHPASFPVAFTALDTGRYSIAWGCVGLAQACLDSSIRYTSSRKQFGVCLRDHQLIKRMIADHSYIGSGAVVLGRATIEAYCLIGANTTIKDGIRVGAKCIIGAGVTLLHDTGEKQVYANTNAQRLPLSSDQL